MNLSVLHHQFCQYKTTFENVSPRTIDYHIYNFQSFFRYSKLKTLDQVTRLSVEQWIIWARTEKGWAPKSARNGLISVNTFLNWCVSQNFIPQNPAKDIPKPKLAKKTPKHLSLEQAEHVLLWTRQYKYKYDYEKNRAVAIMAMFMYSGCRVQELLNLKLKDVNIQNNVLTIYGGKGDKDRSIPISESLKGYLKPYILEREAVNPYSIYFFVSRRSKGRLGEKTFRRLIDKIRSLSKIYFTPHMLRHTFATLMLEGGCDIYSLSKMMGHADIKTTTIYLTATVKHLQSQICKHPLQ